jgi:hypothetical protein
MTSKLILFPLEDSVKVYPFEPWPLGLTTFIEALNLPVLRSLNY